MSQPKSIRPIGGFFETDAQGYLLNPCKIDFCTLQERQALNFCYGWLKDLLADRLHSFWLRGSRARISSRNDRTDLDLFVIIHDVEWRHWVPVPQEEELGLALRQQYGIHEVECRMSGLYPDGMPHPRMAMLMATQSLFLYGTDIRPRLPQYRISNDLLLHFRWLESDYKVWQTGEMDQWAEQSFLKTIIRSGREITQSRSQRFTPDLFYCCSEFSRYYPQQSADIWQLLWHYLHPHLAKASKRACIDRLVPFLSQEIKRHLSEC